MDGPSASQEPKLGAEEATRIKKQSVAPPVAQRIPHVTCNLFGKEIVDDYAWIKGKANAKALKYVEEENAYTEKNMKRLSKLQNSLFDDMVTIAGFYNENKTPYKQIDDYYYYTRTEEEEEYAIHCRKFESLDNEEQVILDENKEAEGEDFFALGPFEVSTDHNVLVYGVDSKGDEQFTLRFRNLVTMEWLYDEIPGCGWTVRWAADNRTVLYTKLDSIGRACRLFQHTVGVNAPDGSDDKELYYEKDICFVVQIATTNNRKFFLLHINGQITNEIHYMPTDNLSAGFQPIAVRRRGVRYSVGAHGSYFYVHTNADNCPNFKVIRTPVADPSNVEQWEEVLPHQESVLVERVELFRHHFVAWEWENGMQKIRVQDLSDNEVHYVALPEPLYGVWPGEIRDKEDTLEDEYFGSNVLRFTYTSFLQPPILYEYDMDRRRKKKATEQKILGFNKEHYHQKRIFIQARDGSMVPISLVYKISLKAASGGNPMLLTAYGAYGGFSLPIFRPDILVLLDRGFIFALAHVRGDATMGTHWYEQGKWLNKKNTFTDFIDCAESLISEGYTTPQKLAITGRSAGGLLVTAVTNMRPDLFKVVVAPVPFVDAIGSMLDPTVPWTPYEWDEWGNPNEEAFFNYMLSYSPYHNIEEKEYPNMLLIAGLNDSRVSYSEPTRFVAKLRRHKTDNNMLLLKTYLAGHLGSAGRYTALEESTFIYAFIIDRLDINPTPTIAKPLLQVISPVAVTPPKLLAMLQGYQVTMILYSALDLGIFNALHMQPKFSATCEVLAQQLRVRTRGLKRLLEALVAVGVLACDEDSIYSLTETAVTHLVAGLPGYVGDLRFTLANDGQWDAMRKLARIVKGEVEAVSNPKDVSYDVAFRKHVAMVLTTVLSTWEKRRKRLTVLDLCCGNGLLGLSITQKNPNAVVYSMDRAERIEASKKLAESMGITDRIHFCPIEYSDTGEDFAQVDLQGPYDLILVGENVLNSFGWANSSSLLQHIGETLQDTGRVVFLEMVGGIDATPDAMLYSVTMLVTQKKGKVHSIDWFNEVLEEGGFGPPTVSNLDPFYEKLLVSSRNIIAQKRKVHKEPPAEHEAGKEQNVKV